MKNFQNGALILSQYKAYIKSTIMNLGISAFWLGKEDWITK